MAEESFEVRVEVGESGEKRAHGVKLKFPIISGVECSVKLDRKC